jgi:ribosomal-protein-alanine N-acetyltransferase
MIRPRTPNLGGVSDELITERLRLRPLTLDDLGDLHDRVYSDPDVTWDGTTSTLEETRESLEAKIRHAREHGFGMMAVTDRETGELYGFAGLQHMEGGPDVEIGYYLARRAWGRGLATELAHALMDMAFGELRLPRVVAVVRPENTASQRVLAKAGLRRVGIEHHYGAEVELWARSTTSAG